MFRQAITYLTCIAMLGMNIMPRHLYAMEQAPIDGLSQAELLEKYPGARVIRVTAEGYPLVEQKLRESGYSQAETIPLGQVLQNEHEEIQQSKYTKPQADDDCDGTGSGSTGAQSINVLVDFTEDMLQSSGNSSRDEAAVLFIIVGTIVLVVWALYVFKYIYDVSVGLFPCGRWNEFKAITNTTTTGGEQHLRFKGLRYTTGFRDGITDVGISFELGQTDVLLKQVGVLELRGRYWLMGPMLRWRLSRDVNPAAFQLDFTAGTTEHSEVGLLAKASMTLLFGIGESMQLGFNWAAVNINLDKDQGIISDHSQYHYLYGINVGFRF